MRRSPWLVSRWLRVNIIPFRRALPSFPRLEAFTVVIVVFQKFVCSFSSFWGLFTWMSLLVGDEAENEANRQTSCLGLKWNINTWRAWHQATSPRTPRHSRHKAKKADYRPLADCMRWEPYCLSCATNRNILVSRKLNQVFGNSAWLHAHIVVMTRRQGYSLCAHWGIYVTYLRGR